MPPKHHQQPVLLEIPIQVVLVGPCNTGKSLLAKQLTQKNALSKLFNSSVTSEDDDPSDISSPSMSTSSSNLIAHDANKSKYPPETALPPFDSIGTTHHSEEFEVDVFEDSSVKIIFVFEIFEIGGASCCGKYMDKKLLNESCANNADLILAVYDCCDRTTLLSLMNETLPVICSASFSSHATAADSFQYAAPIFITGTKIDSRRKLSAEERKNAVVPPDQRELDSKFTNYLMKSKIRDATDGSSLKSVSSTTGSGVMRLRREIFLEVLRKKKSLLEKMQLPNRQTSLWKALTDSKRQQNVSFLVSNVGESLEKARQRDGKSDEKTKKYTNNEGEDDDDQENVEMKNINRNKNGTGKGDNDKLEPPVLDTGSNKDGKKKRKNGTDDNDGESKEKGVQCGMCGCACQ